ncbi:hypothetical protein [Micromonospora sp. NPDC047134]|uniref:hypothetical protein n=1 Tax=Micromonospora sp. NPDC047134 TaxID=3154340 RepID=UPI0033FF8738
MDVDSLYRLRGALLTGVGVIALVAGGWWWRGEAPAGSDASMTSPVSADWQESAASARYDMAPTGSRVMVDPRTGRVVGYATESSGDRGMAREGGRGAVVWTDRASLSAGSALVREARLTRGERNLLIFSCTGPGELLVTVIGARAADPLTVGCDGTVITTEMTGTGAPVTVAFSTAGAASLMLVARLIDPS